MSHKPAAIPLFADAYLADTTHLTTEEHGAYLLLLMAAWRQDDCGLPDDDRKLARIAGMTPRKWASIKSTIMEFWTLENGRIYQSRLRKEHDFVCKKSEANRKAAASRWSKQDAENKQSGAMRSHSDRNAPPPPPIEDTNVSSHAPDEREKVWQHWAKVAVPNGNPAIKKITGQRMKACSARLRDDGLDAICKAIDRIPGSDFLSGRKGDWRADIDFLLRPDSVTKILEGKYDPPSSRAATGQASSTPFLDRMMRERQQQ